MAGRSVDVASVQQMMESDATAPLRVLVVGDRMTDVYIHGAHEGNGQEGCPKFVESYRSTVHGGAANAARSLSRWKTRVTLLAPDLGPVKTRFLTGDSQCTFRHDNEPGSGGGCVEARNQALFQLRVQKRFSAVLLSDYDKGFLTPDFIAAVVEACRAQKIPCVADCKRPPEVYAGAVLKGNEAYWRRHVKPKDHTVVLTRGALPPVTSRPGRVPCEYPMCPAPLNAPCVNHVGAGDCFASHLTLCLAYGLSLREASLVAHSAGRVYVQHLHNRPPLPQEVFTDFLEVADTLAGARGGL